MSDRQEFGLHAFVGFLHYAAGHMAEAFTADTGLNVGSRNPLDVIIDKATGYDRHVAVSFIKWAAREYGEDELPADYLTRLVGVA